ncbi:MAG: hypothetical protein ABIN58_00955 [candidate division WOR-3 bacterium]
MPFFQEWTLSPPTQVGRTRSWHFRAVSHSEIQAYRRTFYLEDRKIIPENIRALLHSPLSLAVWVMDDGSRDKNALLINTQAFSSEEHILLMECLWANFGIEAKLHTDKGKPRIYIPKKSNAKLFELIRSWLIPSVQYKFPCPRND